VTFDSGGISIKPAAGMEDMKWDMGGSAAVIGVMMALAGRKAKVNAVGVIGLVENMPSGTAQRPGDVVTSMSGQTIEVINTDAEGRLVLADALWYTKERFKPRFMIDLATLTGAIVIALGEEKAGLFSNDDALADRLRAAGEAVNEPLWRMPHGEEYDKKIKTDIADMKNVGNRGAGSITAALFLNRFVNDTPWAHLDIAGVAWSKTDRAVTPMGGTGFGVRLLDRLVTDHYEHK
jgi:leucyl aminopeptidase